MIKLLCAKAYRAQCLLLLLGISGVCPMHPSPTTAETASMLTSSNFPAFFIIPHSMLFKG